MSLLVSLDKNKNLLFYNPLLKEKYSYEKKLKLK